VDGDIDHAIDAIAIPFAENVDTPVIEPAARRLPSLVISAAHA
jgi:hypothetical protein